MNIKILIINITVIIMLITHYSYEFNHVNDNTYVIITCKLFEEKISKIIITIFRIFL